MKPAVYARVSTEEQDLQRQLDETTDYLLSRFDVERGDVEYYKDTGSGGDTQRKAFQELLTAVENGDHDTVVVLELSRLSRSMSDLSDTVERLKNDGASLHVVSRDLQLDPEKNDPMTEAFFYLMGIFAQLERDMLRERTRSGIEAAQKAGKHTGRPPYGFTTNSEGYLQPDENYDTAVVALEKLDAGESKRSVANATGISRRTLGRLEENREMYE